MLYLYLYIYMYIYQNAQLHFIEYFVTQIFIFKIILEFISVSMAIYLLNILSVQT